MYSLFFPKPLWSNDKNLTSFCLIWRKTTYNSVNLHWLFVVIMNFIQTKLNTIQLDMMNLRQDDHKGHIGLVVNSMITQCSASLFLHPSMHVQFYFTYSSQNISIIKLLQSLHENNVVHSLNKGNIFFLFFFLIIWAAFNKDTLFERLICCITELHCL